VLGGAGKGAAYVAEQLALEQRLDDGRAVDDEEAPIAPRPGGVERARHELLPGPRLAGDEGGPDVRREAADQAEQLLHRGAHADHPAELRAPRQVVLDREQAPAALGLLAHRDQQVLQPLEVDGLAEIVARPELHRLDCRLHGGIRGHQDDLAVRIEVANRLEDVEAAQLGHAQVDQGQVGPARRHPLDGFTAVVTRQRREPGPRGEARHHVYDARLVVGHDEQGAVRAIDRRHEPPPAGRRPRGIGARPRRPG
jgi:hypothetical protein